MKTFVDTSAFYALLDEDDADHGRAVRWFSQSEPGSPLVTSNYVVIEGAALVQNRLGRAAAGKLLGTLVPKSQVVLVDEHMHALASAAFLAGGTGVSLVDRASFEVMRKLGLRQAFAFDENFGREGFVTVP